MQYVVHRRFRGRSLSGTVNLPYGTVCELNGEIICKGQKPLVVATSENAHQYFSRNDDGRGLERGKLTQQIILELRIRKGETKEEWCARWEPIWNNPSLHRFKMAEHADHWLWNHAFFNAEIEELKYILKVAKGGEICTES